MKVVELKLKDEDDNIEYLRQLLVDNKLNFINGRSKTNKNLRVTLLGERIRKLIDEEELEGLCIFRFYENITIRGLEAEDVVIGERFKIGETVQEITSIGKRCFKKCKLIQSGQECDLFRHIIYTKVTKSGFVRINDRVESLDK